MPLPTPTIRLWVELPFGGSTSHPLGDFTVDGSASDGRLTDGAKADGSGAPSPQAGYSVGAVILHGTLYRCIEADFGSAVTVSSWRVYEEDLGSFGFAQHAPDPAGPWATVAHSESGGIEGTAEYTQWDLDAPTTDRCFRLVTATFGGGATGLGGAIISEWGAFVGSTPESPAPEVIVETEAIEFENLLEKHMRVELNGPGGFKVAIGRWDEQATTEHFIRGAIFRMTFTEIDPEPIGEFILEAGNFKLLSSDEKGGEILDFGGPGSLALLKKCRLWWESVLFDDNPDLEDRVWRFTAENAAGNIVRRLLHEGQGRTPPVIPEVVETFGQFVDSDGVTWDEIPSEWEGRIGSDLLTEVLKFAREGQFDTRMDPGFQWHAYQPDTMGRDLTGTAFGTGVVRFVKGVNIASELEKGMAGREWHSRTLVEKRGGFLVVDHPAPPYADVREGYIDLTSSDDDTTAERAALRKMVYGDAVQNQLTFEIPTPAKVREGGVWVASPVDEANGIYLPGPPWSANGKFWVGDYVTVHTGTGELDFDNETMQVVGISIWAEEADQIRCTVELNSVAVPDDGTLPVLPHVTGETAPSDSSGSAGGGTSHSHPQYQATSQKDQASGYAGLDADGLISDEALSEDTPTAGQLLAWDPTGRVWVDPGSLAEGNVYTVEPQTPHQARHYLMRDGTWRDPFIVGEGTLAVGSISTITNDSVYNAWPSICRIHDRKVLLAYTKADDHHVTNPSACTGKIGTEALDGSITWGSEFTIYDDPSLFVSVRGVSMLASGRIIVTLFRDPAAGPAPLDGAYLVYSDDQGATWSSLVTVNSSLTSYTYMSGPVVQLTDGSLRVTVEGKNTGNTHSQMRVLTSSDDGETWSGEVTLASDQGTRNYYEGVLVLLDNDELICMLRTTDSDGDTYISRSSDGGATWSAPSVAYAGHGSPNTIQMSTGTLLSLTRENAGSSDIIGDVWAYTSIDRGATWDGPVTLDGTMYEMEYASPVELLEGFGRALVVYGYQPTSALTNSDIKQVYVTEDVAAFASGATGVAGGDLSGTYPNPSVVDDSHSHTSATAPGSGAGSHILLADGHGTPFTFDDLLQMDDGSDFMWSDP